MNNELSEENKYMQMLSRKLDQSSFGIIIYNEGYQYEFRSMLQLAVVFLKGKRVYVLTKNEDDVPESLMKYAEEVIVYKNEHDIQEIADSIAKKEGFNADER